MTRIVQQHSTIAVRFLPRVVIAVLVAVLLAASVADAALTTGKCLVQKHLAWDNLRNCQRKAQVKQLKGKPADFATCQTSFQVKLAAITAKATKASIPCRNRDNGDGTVTDYDTGLMWEQKTVGFNGICLFVPLGETSHCVNDVFFWSDAQGFVSGPSTDGATATSFLAGFADWRLPTIAELHTIVDTTAFGCGTGGACIDPIFGPTVAFYFGFWSATTDATNPSYVWWVDFLDGGTVHSVDKFAGHSVRAVRIGL